MGYVSVIVSASADVSTMKSVQKVIPVSVVVSVTLEMPKNRENHANKE